MGVSISVIYCNPDYLHINNKWKELETTGESK